MTNPLVHSLVLIAAIIIPGGLFVYFAWRIQKAKKAREEEKEKGPKAQKILPD